MPMISSLRWLMGPSKINDVEVDGGKVWLFKSWAKQMQKYKKGYRKHLHGMSDKFCHARFWYRMEFTPNSHACRRAPLIGWRGLWGPCGALPVPRAVRLCRRLHKLLQGVYLPVETAVQDMLTHTPVTCMILILDIAWRISVVWSHTHTHTHTHTYTMCFACRCPHKNSLQQKWACHWRWPQIMTTLAASE